MTRRLISTGSAYEKTYGYSRAVVEGNWCFVSGTTGMDYATMTLPDDPATQAHNALATIRKALHEAGFSLADVVRSHVILADPADSDAVLRVHGEAFGEIRPALTAISAALIDAKMKVEIEVTALKRD